MYLNRRFLSNYKLYGSERIYFNQKKQYLFSEHYTAFYIFRLKKISFLFKRGFNRFYHSLSGRRSRNYNTSDGI